MMKTANSLNPIGIDTLKAQRIASELNILLANYQVHYQNLRGFHWNIRGSRFFELHLKFEELYNEALLAVDEIAERVLTLNVQPLHGFSDYLAHSQVAEVQGACDPKTTTNAILDALKILLAKEREILRLAEGAKDDGTADLLTGYISAQEKLIWMFSAYQN